MKEKDIAQILHLNRKKKIKYLISWIVGISTTVTSLFTLLFLLHKLDLLVYSSFISPSSGLTTIAISIVLGCRAGALIYNHNKYNNSKNTILFKYWLIGVSIFFLLSLITNNLFSYNTDLKSAAHLMLDLVIAFILSTIIKSKYRQAKQNLS